MTDHSSHADHRAGLAAFTLTGDVAAITGGAGGIGSATARLFASVGATVAVLDRDGAAAEAVAADIRTAGGVAQAYGIDVGDEAALVACFSRIVDEHGRLSVLVNNAAITLRRPATEITLEDWNQVLGVNMTGVFLCARTAARHMIAAGGGRIVNLASIAGLSGGGLYPNVAYRSSKGAVVNMTRALAVEWAKQGIRVNAVAPGWVRTPMISGLLSRPDLIEEAMRLTPMGQFAEPEHIASAILFLASPASAMVTGVTLPVDGGFLAV